MIAMLVCLLAMLGLQIMTPYWWWVMIVPFSFGAAVATSGWRAIRTGFLSAGILWLGAGTYFYLTGSHLIATRIARMFGLGKSWSMIAATALVAALAAGLSGYAGFAVRKMFRKPAGKETS
jgi:hypothetical protein